MKSDGKSIALILTILSGLNFSAKASNNCGVTMGEIIKNAAGHNYSININDVIKDEGINVSDKRFPFKITRDTIKSVLQQIEHSTNIFLKLIDNKTPSDNLNLDNRIDYNELKRKYFESSLRVSLYLQAESIINLLNSSNTLQENDYSTLEEIFGIFESNKFNYITDECVDLDRINIPSALFNEKLLVDTLNNNNFNMNFFKLDIRNQKLKDDTWEAYKFRNEWTNKVKEIINTSSKEKQDKGHFKCSISCNIPNVYAYTQYVNLDTKGFYSLFECKEYVFMEVFKAFLEVRARELINIRKSDGKYLTKDQCNELLEILKTFNYLTFSEQQEVYFKFIDDEELNLSNETFEKFEDTWFDDDIIIDKFRENGKPYFERIWVDDVKEIINSSNEKNKKSLGSKTYRDDPTFRYYANGWEGEIKYKRGGKLFDFYEFKRYVFKTILERYLKHRMNELCKLYELLSKSNNVDKVKLQQVLDEIKDINTTFTKKGDFFNKIVFNFVGSAYLRQMELTLV